MSSPTMCASASPAHFGMNERAGAGFAAHLQGVHALREGKGCNPLTKMARNIVAPTARLVAELLTGAPRPGRLLLSSPASIGCVDVAPQRIQRLCLPVQLRSQQLHALHPQPIAMRGTEQALGTPWQLHPKLQEGS